MIYRPRHIYPAIYQHLEREEYTILVGARQVGKTSLIRQMYRDLKDAGRRVFYLSFENIDVLREINSHPENVFKYTDRPLNPLDGDQDDQDRIYLLIDEVQNADEPSNFLKYLYDTYLGHLKIVATGSSAFYIDKKFDDSLAGRKRIFKLNRLSFAEFLEFKDRQDLSDELKRTQERSDYVSLKIREIYEYFDEYLIFGGYPAVVLENDTEFKKNLLFELRDSYIKRDVLEADIRNESEFFSLMILLADQIGNLLNKNELSSTLKIHNETLTNYIHILEKCFHIDLIKPFFRNVRKELTKMPKVYYQDTGLRNALLNRFHKMDERADKGALLENYIFLRLKDLSWPSDVRFWRTTDGHEVDFVVTDDLISGKAYEVKYGQFDHSKTPYRKFSTVYPEIQLQGIDYWQAVFL